MSALPELAKKSLPRLYQEAKQAIVRCVEIDECAEWSDKALALEVYALQSKDESLYRAAVQIRARAMRRTGELLCKVERGKGGQPSHVSKGWTHCGYCFKRFKPGQTTDHLCSTRAGGGPSSRGQAASTAGLSVRQRKTALRLANVPEEEFEKAVEAEHPANIKALARMGTNPAPTPKRSKEEAADFAVATEGQAAVGVLYRATKKIDAGIVARGSTKRERSDLLAHSKECAVWLGKLMKAIRRIEP